jgi:hypothetical protein
LARNTTGTDGRKTTRLFISAILLLALFALTACGGGITDAAREESITSEEAADEALAVAEQSPGTESEEVPLAETKQAEKIGMDKMRITVNGQSFTATMVDCEASRAFIAMLPLTLDMSEMNGNEKYYRLGEALTAEPASHTGSIEAGDIMCYSSDCLVVLYDTFSTSYSYVKMGRVDNATEFAAALGGGDVQVTFAAE